MLFSSNIFIFAFLPLVLAAYFLMKKQYRNYLLLIASLIFYAWGEPQFVLVMLLAILFNYVGAILIEARGKENTATRKALLVLILTLDIGILFFFKYLNFLTRNLNTLFGEDTVPTTAIALPIGISFFTFQAISYVIDVYRGDVAAQKNICYLGLYISFFPQLIAGPIVRYSTIAEEIISREVTFCGFSEGVKRFIRGFSKKIILSNAFAVIADQAFSMTGTVSLSVMFAWLGAVSYTLQIFFDFSGYSEMAIGLGRMFGFQFLENFDYPYISKSVSEFWRRWHISLGSWFRDYVYFPLGGSKVKKSRMIFNLLVVWGLTGLWHGASWHFVAWGLMYFILITFEKLTHIPERFLGSGAEALRVLYHIFTMLCIVIGWVLFRANGFINSLRYLSVMFGFSGNVLVDTYFFRYSYENAVLLFVGVLCCTPIFKILYEIIATWLEKDRRIIEIVASAWYIVLFFVSVSYLVIGSHNPFIYFDF